jgi:cell pole-organizing protein PopZ
VNVNDDVLDNIDNALEEAEDETPPPPPQPQVTAKPIAPPPPPPKPTPPSAGEGLVSSVSIAASAEAMRALKSGGNLGSLPFVSGETVEGLVMQLLRPMLKEWLDANLPGIVQQEVQREVQRITASMEQDR